MTKRKTNQSKQNKAPSCKPKEPVRNQRYVKNGELLALRRVYDSKSTSRLFRAKLLGENLPPEDATGVVEPYEREDWLRQNTTQESTQKRY